MIRQEAPEPLDLYDLVAELDYRRGWTFTLADMDRGQGSKGLTLEIRITCADSYDQDRHRTVLHYMPVPPAAYLRRDWQRWLLEQILRVESHEACEFFTIGDVKPYAPNHGDGRDPYTIVEVGTAEDVAARPGQRVGR